MSQNAISLAYLAASVLFILSLKGLSSPESARRGNLLGMLGMAIAVVATLLSPGIMNFGMILTALVIGAGIGSVVARRIQMTAMPELVAAMHSLVGLAAVLIALAAFLNPADYGIHLTAAGRIAAASLIEMGIGAAVGAITFTGSVIAFGKLKGSISSAPLKFAGQHLLNLALALAMVVLVVQFCGNASLLAFLGLVAIALLLGVLLIVPIGGADMPVVVSMLNSYSGWAAAGIGFTLGNNLLIITGALVGSSGAILSYIMCRAMNRSIINVLLGGFGGGGGTEAAQQAANQGAKSGSPEDAAFLMKNAASVIVVPGYGMAVGRAQHAVKEMVDALTGEGVNVRFAIHPVAGRMPGHMNVLLAEAEVPYDIVFEMDEINREFAETDIVLVIGANDVVNPAARTDPGCPIYGMPVLDVDKAKTVMVVKRSLSPGYAGIDNPLFYMENTLMLFGDAKVVAEQIVRNL
ncbi:MAG: NAD(P)(+) transhydrogenase (Re/Si-specific) subunit beta [Nitrospirae bacterium]|nr:NAD(P)(+) transhydrogenase (Re/Si-specific) subunit beta [Nitrospirota bacterium]